MARCVSVELGWCHSGSTDSLDWHCPMRHECGKCSTLLIYYLLITQFAVVCCCHTNWLAISQLEAIAFHLAQLQQLTCAFPMSQPKSEPKRAVSGAGAGALNHNAGCSHSHPLCTLLFQFGKWVTHANCVVAAAAVAVGV